MLGDRNFVQKELDASTCNSAPRPRCCRGGFYTLLSSDIFFTSICRVVSSRAHAVTPHRTLVLKQHRPQVRQGGGLPGTALPSVARSVHGDRGFDWNDVDFLLFGVTTEEIRWLQSGVVVPRVTPPHPGAAPAPSPVGETPTSFARLLQRRPVDLCGPPPSLGLLHKKGERCSLPPAAATRVAPEVRDANVFLWSSARTGLRRFFFFENRAKVHEACGS